MPRHLGCTEAFHPGFVFTGRGLRHEGSKLFIYDSFDIMIPGEEGGARDITLNYCRCRVPVGSGMEALTKKGKEKKLLLCVVSMV